MELIGLVRLVGRGTASDVLGHGELRGSRLVEGGELDFLTDGRQEGVYVGLVESAEDAFPAISEAAFGVVLAMLEEGVEGALAFAVITLDVEQLGVKGIKIKLGKLERFRQAIEGAADREPTGGSPRAVGGQ